MSDWRIKGKVCLVSGATQGIGKAGAQMLAEQGATTIIVGRSAEKCRAVAEEIRTKSGNAEVEAMVADLTSLAAIRQLAEEFKARHARLDVLVNNVGGMFVSRTLTAEGHEATFALNHLGHFLLTHLLLDTLKASAPARIVNVSSHAALDGHLDFDNLMGERGFNGMAAYSSAKLASIVYTFALAKRLEGTGVTANVLHPGTLRTGFMQNNPFPWNLFAKLYFTFMPSADHGGQAILKLAAAPELAGVSGRYFDQMHAAEAIPEAYDVEVQRRLWEISERLVG